MSGIPSAAGLGDKPWAMIDVGIAFLIIVWTGIALRMYVRTVLINSFGWDDWTVLFTAFLFTGECACLIAVAQIELGQPLKDAIQIGIMAEIPILNRLFGLIVVTIGLYLLTTVMLKISLAIFFLRVITNKWHRKVIYITTTIYTIYGVAFAFVGVFQCGNPADYLVNQALGVCISSNVIQPMNYVSATLNALTDWIYVFFPLYVVWHAQMSRSAKISAGVLIGFAGIGSVISLVRIAFISGLKPNPNFFAGAINIAVWSMVEPGICIFAVSLATLRPLFRRLRETSRNMSPSLHHNKGSSAYGRRSKSNTGRKVSLGNRLSSGHQQIITDHEREVPLREIRDSHSGVTFDLAKSKGLGYRVEEVDFKNGGTNFTAPLSPPLPLSPPPPRYVPSDKQDRDDDDLIMVATDRAYVSGGRVVRHPSDPYDTEDWVYSVAVQGGDRR